MRTASHFKKIDVTRAIQAARAAGVEIARVEIDPKTGMIVVVAGKATEVAAPKPANSWDDIYDETA